MRGIKRGIAPVHAGIIFKEEVIDALPRMTVSLAAKALDISRAHLGDVTKGLARVTPELATKIGKATKTSPEMWMNMQQSYDLWMASKNPEITQNVIEGELCA